MKSFLKSKFGPIPADLDRKASAVDLHQRVSVIDPSLFTLPYDEALVRALLDAGLRAVLVGRPPRPGEAAPSVPFLASLLPPLRLGSSPARRPSVGC